MARFGWHQHGLFLPVLALGWALESALAPAQSLPPAQDPVSINSKQANRLVLDQTQPEYPPLAKVNYIQGHVKMLVEITRDGKVAKAHVVRGHPILAASALKAVRAWVYRPLLTPAGPSGFFTTVEVKFTLTTGKAEQVPSEPERDLSRQVKPPEVIERPTSPSSAAVVRVRVLLNDQGQVIDAEPAPGAGTNLGAAEKNLKGWTFRPAHWGALPIPWYLDVDVPLGTSATSQAATATDGR